MNIKNLLLLLLISISSITFAQTNSQKTDEPAIMLMSDGPAQIEISLVNGSKFRVRKITELSKLDFKSVSSFIFYYPYGDDDQDKLSCLLDSLLNGSTNLEVLKFSYGKIKALPKIININAKLKKLDLSHNKLEIQPVGLENFPNLEHLNLEDNNLQALPESLSSLKNLNLVDFSLNSIHKDLFLKSISFVNYKGTLKLFKLGLTEKDIEQIKAKLESIEIYH